MDGFEYPAGVGEKAAEPGTGTDGDVKAGPGPGAIGNGDVEAGPGPGEIGNGDFSSQGTSLPVAGAIGPC